MLSYDEARNVKLSDGGINNYKLVLEGDKIHALKRNSLQLMNLLQLRYRGQK